MIKQVLRPITVYIRDQIDQEDMLQAKITKAEWVPKTQVAGEEGCLSFAYETEDGQTGLIRMGLGWILDE